MISETNSRHGSGVRLSDEQLGILHRGIDELLAMTEGMEFSPSISKRFPHPLANLASKTVPQPEQLMQTIRDRMQDDPVSILEEVLALLELLAVNQPGIEEHLIDDASFVGTCFSSKRCNGWISFLGQADQDQLEEAINSRWKFRFFAGPAGATSLYPLLSMLIRYGYTYGRMPYGDPHAMSHFIEDHTPGLLVCTGKMNDLELTLSLAAMKMGVPAVVSHDYPFELGRSLQAKTTDEICDAVVGFANIRRLLDTPATNPLPEYMSREHAGEKIEPETVWGETTESFYILKKGPVTKSGVEVIGQPGPSMGITMTIDAEPMDAFDTQYLEFRASQAIRMISGAMAKFTEGKLQVELAKDSDVTPSIIGEAMTALLQNEFPKLDKIAVEINFDADQLRQIQPTIAQQIQQRHEEIESATDENVDVFYNCVGCSPFAPDHVCVISPERPPQCGKMYGQIKAGAIYGYDDTSNIHHSKLHRDINSYLTVEKGKCLDPVKGEWEGVNIRASELSGGRTNRIYLHSLDEFPHTGCACYRIIMFKTEQPVPGVGIMAAGYKGICPDGRTWNDLRYALTGRQTPGMAGAAPAYMKTGRFLADHNGWESVVWVCPKIANIMGDKLPTHVEIGKAQE